MCTNIFKSPISSNMCSNWAMDSTWVVGGPNGNTIWEVRSFYFLLFMLCFLHIDEKM